MRRLQITFGFFALALWMGRVGAQTQLATESCPSTTSLTWYQNTTLDQSTTKSGMHYDTSDQSLKLDAVGGGGFVVNQLGSTNVSAGLTHTAVADFNGDGWDDYAGSMEMPGTIKVFLNETYTTPADFGNPVFTRVPKFRESNSITPVYVGTKYHPIVAGDFDGNGKPDILRISASDGARPAQAVLVRNQGVDGFNNILFDSAINVMSDAARNEIGIQKHRGTNIVAADVNGDRKLDFIMSGWESGTNGGFVRYFLNNCTLLEPIPSGTGPAPCSDAPTFVYGGEYISPVNYPEGSKTLPVFDYGDVNGDGMPDLVVGHREAASTGSLGTNLVKIWTGVPGNGISGNVQHLVAFGGAIGALRLVDITGDGRLDLVLGTGNKQGQGGRTVYFENKSATSANPFSGGFTYEMTAANTKTTDWDTAIVIDYDHDPVNSPDLLLSDEGDVNKFYLMINKVQPTTLVACGEAVSEVLDMGSLADEENAYVAARLRPTHNYNGGTVNYYVSNTTPPQWVEATPCPSQSSHRCANFPSSLGRDIRWRIVMCKSSQTPPSPRVTRMGITVDYTEASEHYRAGVVANDGVVYVGGFQQPGDRGKFYALNAQLTEVYWEAGAKLDAMTDDARSIFTASADGNRLDFANSAADNVELQSALGTTSEAQTQDVINWVRSQRFGRKAPFTRFGGIETSTAAVVPAPGFPLWYIFASAEERAKVDEFIATYSNRPTMVMVGSRDGMVHAIRNNPRQISNQDNGKEAWAYVPPSIASRMLADYTASQSAGYTTITAYPDGSPTIADVVLGGDMKTVALIGDGRGGSGVSALDITSTIDPNNGNAIGPTPLWHKVPANAGRALAKPAIARVKIDDTDTFIALVGSGSEADTDPTTSFKGRELEAYRIEDGKLLWRFRGACSISSDIAAIETDDDLELGAPEVDGYTDRVFFADRCGNIYKLNPSVDLDGGFLDNNGYGNFLVENASGAEQYALFSTEQTTDALGERRPITGVMGARQDATGRLVLFFGTGGEETFDPTKVNEFYAVYADTGEVRTKLTGDCIGGRCQKFYGGALVTASQVFFTRTRDAEIGTGQCVAAESIVGAMAIEPDNGEFVIDFENTVTSAILSALYGDADSVYFTTLSGEVRRIGEPRAAVAGQDSENAANGLPGAPQFSNVDRGFWGTSGSMVQLGWRQLY